MTKPKSKGKRLLAPSLLALLALAFAAVGAQAKSALAPENLAAPNVTGTAKEGARLSASKGLWANSPTSYVYKWQRCSTDGSACSKDVQTGSKNTYLPTSADVQHTIRVVVTALNADGRGGSAPSDPTLVVSSKNGPKSTAAPTISGDATEGQQLTVTAGSWTPSPATIAYQWQRCDAADVNCHNIPLAKTTSYTLNSADVGLRLRVLVIAKTATGSTSAYTDDTDFVQSNTPPTTTTTNQAPTLRFLSLTRIGRRVYARFRVCDDGLGRITVVERDRKAGALSYTRRYSVYTYASCGTYSRSWTPAPRFRTHGRMTVTLQAIDKSGKTSFRLSKSVVRPS